MRSRRLLAALAAAALLVLGSVAGPAAARPLPFAGTLGLVVGTLPPSVLGGAGIALVNGSGGGAHLNALSLAGGTFATTGLVIPVTDPNVAPVGGIQVTGANGAGAFASISGGGPSGGGVMPMLGVAKVCLFGPCAAASANLTVPLSVIGAGGVATAGAAVPVTVIGAPWTLGPVTLGTFTAMGFAHGPASGTSSTALQSGVVQLVTPILVSTTLTGALPSFGVLTLHFVPEPGTILLVGAGIAGLVLLGRRAR